MNDQLTVYYNGEFMLQDEVKISPNDRGFVFGDGAYEVFRSYKGKLFFADEHIIRLQYSLDQLRIEFENLEQIIPIVHQLIEKNDLQNTEATIYLQITRGVFKRMHAFPDEKVKPTLFIRAKKFTSYSEQLFQNGVKAITLDDFRWTRCDIKSTALLSNILSAQQAADCEAFESIFIRNSIITEGSHTNVFANIGGKLYTHPKSNHILSGISREIVIDICLRNNIPIEEKAFTANQLQIVDELFLVGTSTEIMPVVQLNDSIVGDGSVGLLTKLIQKLYRDFIKDNTK